MWGQLFFFLPGPVLPALGQGRLPSSLLAGWIPDGGRVSVLLLEPPKLGKQGCRVCS